MLATLCHLVSGDVSWDDTDSSSDREAKQSPKGTDGFVAQVGYGLWDDLKGKNDSDGVGDPKLVICHGRGRGNVRG